MDLLKKKPKKIKLDNNSEILEFNKIKDITNIFDLFCKYNLDLEKSNILKKKYNIKNNKIEIFNYNEYYMLYDFIYKNSDLEENLNKNDILGTREGNIILEGYKKILLNKNLINFEITEYLKIIKNETFYYLGEDNDLKFCLNI